MQFYPSREPKACVSLAVAIGSRSPGHVIERFVAKGSGWCTAVLAQRARDAGVSVREPRPLQDAQVPRALCSRAHLLSGYPHGNADGASKQCQRDTCMKWSK